MHRYESYPGYFEEIPPAGFRTRGQGGAKATKKLNQNTFTFSAGGHVLVLGKDFGKALVGNDPNAVLIKGRAFSSVRWGHLGKANETFRRGILVHSGQQSAENFGIVVNQRQGKKGNPLFTASNDKINLFPRRNIGDLKTLA